MAERTLSDAIPFWDDWLCGCDGEHSCSQHSTDTTPDSDTDAKEANLPDTEFTVRAVLKHHHMGDYSVHRFLAEMLTEMKEDGAIVDFEILATSRTEWMELGIYSVDLFGVVNQTMTWAQGKVVVEEYMTSLFRDEMLVEGLYGLAPGDATDTDPVPAAGVGG